jgi:protein SCO1/2
VADARSRAGIAAAIALSAAGTAAAAPPGSPWGANYFPNVTLTTHDGREVKFYDDLVKDKHVVVTFIYSRCNKQCGPMTANLVRVKRIIGDRAGKDIHFYSITMDPERDTPEVLSAYARAYKAGDGWTFLTGKKEDLDLLRKKFGDMNPVEDHSVNIRIGNDRIGQWMATSALDNPQFLANVIENWLDPGWTGSKPARSYTDAPPIPRPSPGQAIFAAKCAACHEPGGTSVGPDLAGVVARRDRAWLTEWIKAPEKLVAAGDRAAVELVASHDGVLMPNQDLSDRDVAAVIEFLETRRPRPPAPQ